MLKQKASPRRRFIGNHPHHPGVHASALYGLDYPPDHLRIVAFTGDTADITRGLLWFDRDLGPLPGDVNLWCGERKAFNPVLVDARRVRVFFNCPIYTSSAWSWDTAGGDFTGRDGAKYALPASGVLQEASGPSPAGKIWITSITRFDATSLDYQFSQTITSTGDPTGFWCTDELGNIQLGNSIPMTAGDTLRISFLSNIAPAPSPAGIVAGFSGISEYADLLAPVTWRV